PGGRTHEPGHDVEERRLPRAVRPDQAARTAREDHRHPVDRRHAAETDGQVLDLDHAGLPLLAAQRLSLKSSRARFFMSFGNCTARPPGAVRITGRRPTPKMMLMMLMAEIRQPPMPLTVKR